MSADLVMPLWIGITLVTLALLPALCLAVAWLYGAVLRLLGRRHQQQASRTAARLAGRADR